LSVTALADPDGLTAATVAPDTPVRNDESETLPLSAPVVPANAGVTKPQSSAARNEKLETIHVRDMRPFPESPSSGVSGA
jgi:hypothetical protein